MSNLIRKPRCLSLNDFEVAMLKTIMDYYHMNNVSEVMRYLIMRENARIEQEVCKAVADGR